MPWNLSSDRPIFLQIVERIEMDIISGVYQPGQRLPAVRELASCAARQSEHYAKSPFRTRKNRLSLQSADERTFYHGGYCYDRRIKTTDCRRKDP